MTGPPDEPAPELERVVDAISDGASVAWEAELEGSQSDRETLAALRLIDQVARLHRGESGPAPEDEAASACELTWGSLVIRGRLGQGVYGEVYRAFDPGLRREVALKLWSETVRPRTIERLLEEARALASVRHPNVLAVYGADVHNGRVGMWTELLEGDTLEHFVTEHGRAHWREAALYGIELCRALAAIHAIGFVHCDVKAANVMRERGGRVVLMDFGSASRFGAADAEGGPPAGIQGTPLLMAPEVLAGSAPAPASDVYSLGALLFSVVAGRYPVEADSLEELRAKLQSAPLPSLRAVRPEVPVAFARVIERALERSPGERLASATELEQLLAEAVGLEWGLAPASALGRRGSLRDRLVAWGAFAAVLVLAAVGVWWSRREPSPGLARPMQFTLQLPLGEHLPQFANVVVSPDGGAVAFASTDSSGTSALWIRRFDARGCARIPGTEGAWYPFWSPDSRDIAFFSGSQLMRVDAMGGRVQVVCRVELGRGGSWGRDGTIVFASSPQGPLLRVPAAGGTPVPATTLDPSRSEVSHRWPCFLPDGDHFLYVSTPARQGGYDLFVGALHSDRRAYVGPVESGAVYTSGKLVYVLNQTLEARPFNLRTLRWSGEPVPISDLPAVGGSLAEPHASVSQNGTLVASSLAARESRLEWVDLGTGEVKTLSAGPYFHPNLSPDGRRIAVEKVEGPGRSNVWMVDAQTGAAERLTDDEGFNRTPIWSPAGDSIVFSSNRSGQYELYERSTGGSLGELRLYAPPHALLMWPNDWRPGGLITFDLYEPGSGYNVYELRSGVPVPVARAAASEMRGALSPDGRWLAYDSDAAGLAQIYLLDRVTSERFVLPGGGMQPRWARETGRLYFHAATGTFFEVTPVQGRRPTEWPSRRLFRSGVIEGYDVDALGSRILCCLKSDPGRPEQITVLTNLPQAVRHGL